MLNQEETNWLVSFLERGDITYTTPGRKDQVYLGKKDGISQYAQKRYLRWNLRDLFKIINGNDEIIGSSFQEGFGHQISFSLFYDFIKDHKEYVFNKHIPQSSCLCEICENVALLSRGIQNALKIDIPVNTHTVVETYSCNSKTKECMMDDCEDCAPDNIINITTKENIDVSFYKWCKVNKATQKKEFKVNCEEAITLWKESVVHLKQHIHRKRVQTFSLNTIKEELKPSEILLHVDFSESYKNAAQDEIQSAYFGHSTFSLFTACVYTGQHENEKILVTVVTESNEHSRVTSLSCIDRIIRYVEGIIGEVDKIFVWSDGCSAQFRSRFVFSFLADFHHDKSLEWHYNEAHHGKGPMDGVGGTSAGAEYNLQELS